MARKVFPKHLHFLLADLVRQEMGGKLSILGVYAGGDLVIQDALPTLLPAGLEALALPGLTIVTFINDGCGTFKVKYSLTSPSGLSTSEMQKENDFVKPTDRAATMIVRFEPFPIKEFGKYVFTCNLDDHKYSYEFFVKHQDPQAKLPVAVTPSIASEPAAKKGVEERTAKSSKSTKSSRRQPRAK